MVASLQKSLDKQVEKGRLEQDARDAALARVRGVSDLNELADCDLENNFWPRRAVKTRFQLHKEEAEKNPLRELTRPAPAPKP